MIESLTLLDSITLSFALGTIALLGVFIVVRVTNYAHNIQDIQIDAVQWGDTIYSTEFLVELQKNPVDPLEIMNIAAKYFSVKNLGRTLETLEESNQSELKREIGGIILIIILLGISILANSSEEKIANVFTQLNILEELIPLITMGILGIFLYKWYDFFKFYSSFRKKIKSRIV